MFIWVRTICIYAYQKAVRKIFLTPKEGKKYISKIDIKDKDVKIRKEYKKYLKKAYPDINFNEVYAKEKVVYVREKSNTEIIKIQCKDGNLKIISDGVVDGTIDDNLSVDEYKGHIRNGYNR